MTPMKCTVLAKYRMFGFRMAQLATLGERTLMDVCVCLFQ
jgi:hypothetical protein